MRVLRQLFENNKKWAGGITASDPDFFSKLAAQQTPDYLWIGCSDSRVPATQLVGLSPGDMFEHRNVANVVGHTDLNCLSVMQYAVEALKVQHIIVCGHYRCGGVQAAYANQKLGLIDNWLRHVQDVADKHAQLLAAIPDEGQRLRRLCELNVVEQVANVSRTTVVEGSWARGQALAIHGWIYDLDDGLLRDLGVCMTCEEETSAVYNSAVEQVGALCRVGGDG
jgi:carbonic anhydrase